MLVTDPIPASTGARSPRRLRDWAIGGALLALFLVGIIGMAAATGWHETWEQVSRLGPPQVFALLALSLLNYLLRGLRWHLFARLIGLGTALSQNLRHFLGGFAMSVTPGRLGELVRMRWIGRETGWSFERTAPLMLVDRASDLAAMALILAASAVLATGGLAGALPVALLALLAAVVATRPALLSWAVTLAYRILNRWPRLFARVRRAVRALSVFSGGPALAGALALGIAGWLAEAYSFHLLLTWMGADIGLAKAAAIFIFATLAGGLTGAPGGLGGAEAAMIALLGMEGVPLAVALPATAIIRVTTLWFALLLGLAVFPLAESLSRKGQHRVEIG
ncbi:MAG: lysylphosphatidylglycerol synthase transmembrane domain-containing protein [Paracoccaceae bacterium]